MARIVVVDDSVFLAEKIKGFLESRGHEVIAMGEDGNEGVALYREHRPDLVTLDITMPNKDGHDCLSEIMQIDNKARVVVVSAIDDQSVILDCMNIGAMGFIEKPLKFKNHEFCESFAETINAALN